MALARLFDGDFEKEMAKNRKNNAPAIAIRAFFCYNKMEYNFERGNHYERKAFYQSL